MLGPNPNLYLTLTLTDQVFPNPASLVAIQTKRAYGALLIAPVKRIVKKGASEAVSTAVSRFPRRL